VATRMLELKVGAAVLIASLILVFGVMWFQGFRFGEETLQYNVVFHQVGRLTEDDLVTVGGVRAGKVTRVQLRDTDILVKIAVNRSVRLREDCQVHIANVGIMGERFINIIQGESDKIVQEGAYLQGFYDEGLSEIMGATGTMLKDMTEITDSFNDLIKLLREDERLKETGDRLIRLTARVDSIVTVVAPDLTQSMRDVREISGDLKDLLEENAEPVREGVVSFKEATAAFERAGLRVDTLTTRLSALTDALEDDNSNLGRLLKDGDLVADIEETVRDLDDLLADMQANPKKYFRFSVIDL
jgi:phospholipid/cholesterol/gamma-HCH transport system substrate-binding protein